jgi:hypothetical protein
MSALSTAKKSRKAQISCVVSSFSTGLAYLKNVEMIAARDARQSVVLAGANAEAAARKSTETHISRKPTAAGTKRSDMARDMTL